MEITVETIMSWEPCHNYTRRDIQNIIGDGKTLIEICDLDVPARDRLWVLLREDFIPEDDLHLFGCFFAEDVLTAERLAGREPHPDSWNAIKTKRAWIKGETKDEEMFAARRAAFSVLDLLILSNSEKIAAVIAAWAAICQAEVSVNITAQVDEDDFEGMTEMQEKYLARIKKYLEEREK